MEFCDWCQGGACDLVYNSQGTVEGDIDEETGIMTFYAMFDEKEIKGSRRVKFCPMCGRHLGSYDTSRYLEVLIFED